MSSLSSSPYPQISVALQTHMLIFTCCLGSISLCSCLEKTHLGTFLLYVEFNIDFFFRVFIIIWMWGSPHIHCSFCNCSPAVVALQCLQITLYIGPAFITVFLSQNFKVISFQCCRHEVQMPFCLTECDLWVLSRNLYPFLFIPSIFKFSDLSLIVCMIVFKIFLSPFCVWFCEVWKCREVQLY